MQAEASGHRGLWRAGKILVMEHQANVGDRCLKSNVPTKRTLKRTLSWHHPAVFAAVLISPLIYIILALLLRRKATIYIGLSDKWFAKRRMTILVSWGVALSGIGMILGGIVSWENQGSLGWLVFVGSVDFFAGLLYGLIGARMVTPSRMSATYIWLRGVHPDFLEDLPIWGQTSK